MQTLEEQFKFLDEVPLKEKTDTMREGRMLNDRKAAVILRYIINNKCILEHRNNLDSDQWRPGTIREFLSFLLSCHESDKNQNGFYNWMLNFWRIKTHPTAEEIRQLTTIQHKAEI